MGKAGKPLHVLRIEDSEDEVSRLADELEQGGYDPAFRQVHSREEMEEALGEKNWDVVISGYRPPLFGAEEALGLLREKQKDVPLIVISEEVGEETVRLMRSGARDFIPSGSLYRLAPAVDRELQVAEDRRERGAAEGRLRRSEERYRAVVEQTIEAIFLVDVETRRVVDSNPAFRQMFGYSEEELADLTLYEMVDNDPESIDANIEIILSNGYYRVRERRYRRRDGSLVDMEISVSLVSLGGRDVMCAVAHDITKRKVAEEEMRRHSTAIEGAIDGIAIIDAEGAYTYMNQAHASIYGYDRPEELVGRSWRIHYDEEQVKTSDRQSLPALRDSGYWRGESTGMRKDGSTFPQELSLTALEDGGVVCVVRDVTERKVTEERLRQSLNALLAVYEAGQILSSTLEAEEVGTRLLQLIRRISSSATAVISTPDESGELSV